MAIVAVAAHLLRQPLLGNQEGLDVLADKYGHDRGSLDQVGGARCQGAAGAGSAAGQPGCCAGAARGCVWAAGQAC